METNNKSRAPIPRKHKVIAAAVTYIMAVTGSILKHPITCLILFCTLMFVIIGWDPVTNEEASYKQLVVFNLSAWLLLQMLFSVTFTIWQYYRVKYPEFNNLFRK